MGVHTTLREANRARQIEWDTNGDITLSYAGNELAGEAGELLEAVADYVYGESNNLEAIRQEIGDVIICCDLIGLRLNLGLEHSPDLVRFGGKIVPEILIEIGIQVGMVCNTIKKQERARFGMVGAQGSLEDLNKNLNEVILHVHRLAAAMGLEAVDCVAEKFNLTSRKYGLETIMVPNG